MESKHMTLRSQTVQCPHCGEYYSVTYKYCPFCDAGRKAEARKKAARKQQAASLFTGLFSGKDDDGMDVPVRESGQHRERQGEPRQRQSEPRQRQSGHRSEFDGEGEPRHRQRPVQYDYDTPIPRSEGFRKKKTSEMTEEEKKAYRAEREARAAARKRERDRAARAASLTDLSAPDEAVAAAETAPVAPPAATTVLSPSGMETVEITIDPMSTAPADLIAAAVAQQAAAESEDVDLTQEAEDASDAAAEEIIPTVEVPTPTPEVTPKTYDPSRILEGDSELDELLSEIRGLLDEGPSAPVEAPAPDAAVQAMVEETQAISEEMPLVETDGSSEPDVSVGPAADAAPETVPAEGAAPAVSDAAPAAEDAVQAAVVQTDAAETPAAEPQPAAIPTTPPPGYEDPELIWSPETTAAVEAAAINKAEETVPAGPRQRAERQPRPRKKQKASLPLIPIIAAIVVVVILAVVLVTRLSSPKEAESISFTEAQVTLSSPEDTLTLTPVFGPEGSTGEVKWTCSNWGVVDVNPEGLLTPKAPGTAIVAATLSNGATTSIEVICAWGDDMAWATEGEAVEGEGEATVETAGLSATDLTLDAQGDTQQLTLNGVAGTVTWTSSKPSVASVSPDGLVTAVNKGSATITAEANGSKYNCNVRCVW